MNVALWVVQALLALAFFGAGMLKITQSKEFAYERGQKFVEDFSQGTLRLIGLLEVAAALGLILPLLLNVLPILTPLAAVGLVIVMLGAAYTHLRRNEYSAIIPNIVLLALAAFVAYGRFVLLPVA